MSGRTAHRRPRTPCRVPAASRHTRRQPAEPPDRKRPIGTAHPAHQRQRASMARCAMHPPGPTCAGWCSPPGCRCCSKGILHLTMPAGALTAARRDVIVSTTAGALDTALPTPPRPCLPWPRPWAASGPCWWMAASAGHRRIQGHRDWVAYAVLIGKPYVYGLAPPGWWAWPRSSRLLRDELETIGSCAAAPACNPAAPGTWPQISNKYAQTRLIRSIRILEYRVNFWNKQTGCRMIVLICRHYRRPSHCPMCPPGHGQLTTSSWSWAYSRQCGKCENCARTLARPPRPTRTTAWRHTIRSHPQRNSCCHWTLVLVGAAAVECSKPERPPASDCNPHCPDPCLPTLRCTRPPPPLPHSCHLCHPRHHLATAGFRQRRHRASVGGVADLGWRGGPWALPKRPRCAARWKWCGACRGAGRPDRTLGQPAWSLQRRPPPQPKTQGHTPAGCS